MPQQVEDLPEALKSTICSCLKEIKPSKVFEREIFEGTVRGALGSPPADDVSFTHLAQDPGARSVHVAQDGRFRNKKDVHPGQDGRPPITGNVYRPSKKTSRAPGFAGSDAQETPSARPDAAIDAEKVSSVRFRATTGADVTSFAWTDAGWL